MAQASSILGFVDGVLRGRLHGWALDRDNPGRRLSVAVTGSTRFPVVVVADRYRADLQQHGYGDGHYGFSAPIGHVPTEAIAVHVISERPSVSLPCVKGTRRFPNAHSVEFGSQTLQIDDVTQRGHVSGWAWNRERPTHRCVLQLILDGLVQQTRRATLYRKELVTKGCDGYHGFHFAVPAGSGGRLILRDVTVGRQFRIYRHGIRCA